MKFRIKGSLRRVGAIGSFERFNIGVEAENETKAREQARAQFYGGGYEHVHIKNVSEVENGS